MAPAISDLGVGMSGPLCHIDPDCESRMEADENSNTAGIIEGSKMFEKIMTISKDTNKKNLFKFFEVNIVIIIIIILFIISKYVTYIGVRT